MRVYTVHERPVPLGEDRDVVLVKEGFSWPALLLPALWGLYHRLWLGVLVYAAAAAALGVAAKAVGLGEAIEGAVGVAFALIVGFEANDWRRRSLARRGYRLLGVASGEDLVSAEERVFMALPAALKTPPAPAPAPTP